MSVVSVPIALCFDEWGFKLIMKQKKNKRSALKSCIDDEHLRELAGGMSSSSLPKIPQPELQKVSKFFNQEVSHFPAQRMSQSMKALEKEMSQKASQEKK